jgi:hypothetical protein
MPCPPISHCRCCLRHIRTYWFIRLVLPTPLSPRMMTWYIRQHLKYHSHAVYLEPSAGSFCETPFWCRLCRWLSKPRWMGGRSSYALVVRRRWRRTSSRSVWARGGLLRRRYEIVNCAVQRVKCRLVLLCDAATDDLVMSCKCKHA